MHFALALLIAMAVATAIVGVVMLISGIRHAPEAYEDETGFWPIEKEQTVESESISGNLARVPVADSARDQVG